MFVGSFLQRAKLLFFSSHQTVAAAGSGRAVLSPRGRPSSPSLCTHHIQWSPGQLGDLALGLLQCFNPPGFPGLLRSLLACLSQPVLLHGLIPASTGICLCCFCTSQGCPKIIFSRVSVGSSALQDINQYPHFNTI